MKKGFLEVSNTIKSMQEIIAYLILILALAYLAFRFFGKSKKPCANCEGACSKIDFDKIDIEKTFKAGAGKAH